MLSNFKKRFRTKQISPAETVHENPGRTCTRSRTQSDARPSLPSSRDVIQVLYPPSYLGIPPPFLDPPPYPAQEDGAELISSAATGIQGSRSRPDPLAEDPSLTGVPSQGTSASRVPSVELDPPIIGCSDHSEETEPLPAYSRLDQRRPRVASDVLGPYPPLSVPRQSAQ